MDTIDVINKIGDTKKPREREGIVRAKHFTHLLVQPKGSTRPVPCDYESGATVDVGDQVTFLWVQSSKKYIVSAVISIPKTIKPTTGTVLVTNTDHVLHDNIGGEILSVRHKATPVDDDLLFANDSADGYRPKSIRVGDLPGGGGSIAVDDGTDTVDPASQLSFDPTFFDVSDGGGDQALVTFVGAGGGATSLNDLTDVDTVSTPPTDGQALIFDGASSLWKPGNNSSLVNPLVSTGDILSITEAPIVNSGAHSGVINHSNAGAEKIITGCDLINTNVGSTLVIDYDVWWSTIECCTNVYFDFRIRRDDLSGTQLYYERMLASATDSTGGHIREWVGTFTDTAPTDGHYILSFLQFAGTGVDPFYTDTRVMTITASVAGLARIPIGSEKQVLTVQSGIPTWDWSRAIYSTANVSNPPTASELTSAFGSPGGLSSGFMGIVNDNNAGTNEYFCWTDGTNWFYTTGTKAI